MLDTYQPIHNTCLSISMVEIECHANDKKWNILCVYDLHLNATFDYWTVYAMLMCEG